MRRLSWVFVAIGAVAVLAGCSKGNFSERTSAGKGNIFRYPISGTTKLDPAMVQDGDTIDAIQQVFEGLVKWDTNNKVVPNLAESWTVSPDGRTYTFTLVKGAK